MVSLKYTIDPTAPRDARYAAWIGGLDVVMIAIEATEQDVRYSAREALAAMLMEVDSIQVEEVDE